MKYVMLTIVLAVPSASWAQPESQLPAIVDTRSMSLGRTSIIAAEGSNAIFSNPAILGTIDDMQLQGGGRIFFGGVATDDDGTVESATLPRNTRFVDHLSFATPYALADSAVQLAFGVGYHSYYDHGYNVGDDEAEVIYTSRGGLNMISPAAAISYQEKYFAGISLHKSIRSDITVEYENFNSEEETETSGAFFLLGVLAQLDPGIMLGGMYRSAFEWEMETENGVEIEEERPALWGLGASFRLSPRWLLVGEYRSWPFSDYEINGANRPLDDGYSIRGGVEIGRTIPFRFGIFRDAMMERDFDSDDPKYLNGATFGIGFPITGIHFDLGAEAGYWQEKLSDDVLGAQLLVRFRFAAQYRFVSE